MLAQVSTPLPKPNAPDTSAPPARIAASPEEEASAKQARTLLDQMIAALGGQAFLNYTDKQETGRRYAFDHNGQPLEQIGCGTIIVVPSCSDYSGSAPVFVRYWKWPDKERWEMFPNKSWVIIINGDQGTESVSKDSWKLPSKDLADYRNPESFSLEAITREWLKDPKAELYYDGKTVAEQKEADQVTVMTGDRRSVDIYIDSRTHLPLRLERTFRDRETRERVKEAQTLDNYRPEQGMQTPHTITLYRNDIIFSQRFLNGVKYNLTVPEEKFDLARASR